MAFIEPQATGSISVEGSAAGLLLIAGVASATIDVVGDGDLVRAPLIENARALTSTRIRIDFTEVMDPNSQLATPGNYNITPSSAGAVKPAIQAVTVPDTDFPRFVELTVSELTEGGSYEASVTSSNVTSGGVPVVQDPFSFTGIGVLPSIVVVVATSSTTAEVRFNEPIRDAGAVRDTGSYTFTSPAPPDDLVVVDVLSVEGNVVTLETTTQEEGTIYTLEVDGNISDNANNNLAVPATSTMLGFEAPEETAGGRLQRMYLFLLQGIRDSDKKDGEELVRRLIEGSDGSSGLQSIWNTTTETINNIPTLWDVVNVDEEWLPFLRRIVGFTQEFDGITDALDTPTLRRLIASAVAFWKSRGPEDAIESIVRLATGARVVIRNWFYYRAIVDEAHFGQELDGNDPWLVSLPRTFEPTGEADENTYNLRVVDDGTLNRDLIRELAKLTRPVNERVEIIYLRFLDTFTTSGDFTQWTVETGSDPVVSGGTFSLSDAAEEMTIVSVSDASAFSQYLVSVRLRGSGVYRVRFYQSGPDDWYMAEVEPAAATNQIRLVKSVAGVETTVLSETVVDFLNLVESVYYMLRVEVTDAGATNQIGFYLDADLVLSTTDADHSNGSIGLGHAAGGTIEVDEVELFLLPAQTDFIDIS